MLLYSVSLDFETWTISTIRCSRRYWPFTDPPHRLHELCMNIFDLFCQIFMTSSNAQQTVSGQGRSYCTTWTVWEGMFTFQKQKKHPFYLALVFTNIYSWINILQYRKVLIIFCNFLSSSKLKWRWFKFGDTTHQSLRAQATFTPQKYNDQVFIGS